jgi:RNA polymerase sigma factor (sigma-70 family)
MEQIRPDGESRTTVFPSRGARDEGSALEFDRDDAGAAGEARGGSDAAGRVAAIGGTPVGEAARKRVVVETFARHEASLRRTAARYSICDDDADEALQRGLEILLLKAPSDDPRELVRWTQTVVKHEALSVRAERERVLAGPAALPVHPTQEDWIAMLPSELDGPPERAERDEAVERSREALTTLKPQELRALSLLAEGYSYREIAEITSWSATKVNRCVSEGRERFRRFLVRRDGGERCAELAPLLSAFADDEAAAADVTTLREHLRTCPHCRSTLRAYRAAPHAAAALFPALPPTRGTLLGRLHDAYAAVATRVGGGSGASDSTLGGIASAGGTRGAGMTALAKLLAVCAGTVGGAACVATGVIPAPLIDQPEHHPKPAAKVIHHRPRELAREATETSSVPDYATEPPNEVEPEPQPRETARAEGEAEKREKEAAAAKAREEERAAEEEASEAAGQSAPPPTENGATEFVESAPPPPPPSEPTGSTAPTTSASAPSGSDGSKGTAAGELGP